MVPYGKPAQVQFVVFAALDNAATSWGFLFLKVLESKGLEISSFSKTTLTLLAASQLHTFYFQENWKEILQICTTTNCSVSRPSYQHRTASITVTLALCT